MIDWKPIAEMPSNMKDGRWLLLKGGIIDYGYPRGTPQPPCVVAQWAIPFAVPRWQFAWYDDGYYGEYVSPTHYAEIQLK